MLLTVKKNIVLPKMIVLPKSYSETNFYNGFSNFATKNYTYSHGNCETWCISMNDNATKKS